MSQLLRSLPYNQNVELLGSQGWPKFRTSPSWQLLWVTHLICRKLGARCAISVPITNWIYIFHMEWLVPILLFLAYFMCKSNQKSHLSSMCYSHTSRTTLFMWRWVSCLSQKSWTISLQSIKPLDCHSRLAVARNTTSTTLTKGSGGG